MNITDEMIELQTRIVFQEQALEEMSAVVTRQQNQLDSLLRKFVMLKEQYESQEQHEPTTGSEQDERPPHY